MTVAFHAPYPWVEIQKRLTPNRRAFVAVPYLGTQATDMLPLAPGSKLVTCLSEDAVKSGALDPREVIKYLQAGVEVYHHPDLHAKVYVLGSTAFIGSANLSSSSAQKVEACIRTSDRRLVANAKQFILDLCVDPQTPRSVQPMVQLYRQYANEHRLIAGRPERARRSAARPTLWITPVEVNAWTAEENATQRKELPHARQQMTDESRFVLDDFVWTYPTPFVVNDLITLRWNYGRGYRFQHPARVIRIKQVAKTGHAIVFVERPKYRRDLLSSKVRSQLAESAGSFVRPGHASRRAPARAIAPFLRLWDR